MSKELEALYNLTDDFFIETKRPNGEDMTINISDTEEFDIIKQKLEVIAELEEELGCPLEVLNAKSVMYIRDNETLEGSVYGINLQNKKIMIGSAWSFLEKPLNQFGKTFWLKEDRSE